MTDEERALHLLRQAVWILQSLPWANELDGRRRRETHQAHSDRIAMVIEENEARRLLIEEIEEFLPAIPEPAPIPPHESYPARVRREQSGS